MTSISLYKAAHLAQLEQHIDPDTGELNIEAFDAAQMLFVDKGRAVAAFIKNRDAEAKMIDDAAKELAERSKAVKARNERLKAYLLDNMKAGGIDSISAENGTFSVKLEIGRDESVQLDEGVTFDESLLLPAKPREPSKALIKAAILKGEPIAGARIVKKDRLTIK